MTADEAAFLARIREEPDADLPRLVFADYLEEQGHEQRAQFIRAQIELATLTDDSPRRRELAWHCRQHIEGETMASPQEPLWARRPRPEPLKALRPRYARGLIEYAEFWVSLLETVENAFRYAPLRRVWMYYLDEQPSLLEGIPTDNCLRVLDLTGNDLTAFMNDGLHLLDQPFLHLKELVLTGCRLSDEQASILCSAPFFRTLKRIHLSGNPFTADGRQRLRDHLGNRVTFDCEGDPDRLYPFDHEDGHFTVGFGNDLTQHLVHSTPYGTYVAVFDHSGNLLRASVEQQDKEAILTEFGHTPSTIRVKQFQFSDGIGIALSIPWLGTFDNSERGNRAGVRRRLVDWLGERCFRWRWDENIEWYLNGEGRIED